MCTCTGKNNKIINFDIDNNNLTLTIATIILKEKNQKFTIESDYQVNCCQVSSTWTAASPGGPDPTAPPFVSSGGS